MTLTVADIKVGRVYAAKRPAAIGIIDPLINDRAVIHVDVIGGYVQYDSPTVRVGRKFPRVTMAKFLAWAGGDVTDQCPPGEWRAAHQATKEPHSGQKD